MHTYVRVCLGQQFSFGSRKRVKIRRRRKCVQAIQFGVVIVVVVVVVGHVRCTHIRSGGGTAATIYRFDSLVACVCSLELRCMGSRDRMCVCE